VYNAACIGHEQIKHSQSQVLFL